MKNILLTAFVALSASAYAFTSYDGGSSSSISCWRCEYKAGDASWTTLAASQNQAKSTALSACKKGSSKKCAFQSCWQGPQYGVKSCGINTTKSVASDWDDTYIPPTYPQQNTCSTNNDCSGFDVCVGGKCTWKDSIDNRCSSDMDCGFPNECVRGKCGDAGPDGCDSNSDCSGFDICVSGKCVSDNSFDNRCTGSWDCSFPQSCNDGKCQ